MKQRDSLLATRLSGFACAALLVVSAAGCGGGADDAPEMFDISGNVTFDGKPVPAGMVTFTNEETGYATACPIHDGYYENESGKGHRGGKFTVGIAGDEGEGVAGMPAAPLWEGSWSTEVELPAESTTKDFEISKDEVKPPEGIPADISERS